MHFQNKRILNAHWVFLLGVGIRLKLPFFFLSGLRHGRLAAAAQIMTIKRKNYTTLKSMFGVDDVIYGPVLGSVDGVISNQGQARLVQVQDDVLTFKTLTRRCGTPRTVVPHFLPSLSHFGIFLATPSSLLFSFFGSEGAAMCVSSSSAA